MKRKNIIITTATVIATFIAFWCAFYTEPLSEHQRKMNAGAFDTESYVKEQFQQQGELMEKAMPLKDFLTLLEGKRSDIKIHGRVLGIGSNIFFVVKGEGTVVEKDDEHCIILSEGHRWGIPTRHIFGNLARDASGWFDIDASPTMADFNNISATVNKYLEENVLTDDIRNLKPQETVSFCAATEVLFDYADDKSDQALPSDPATLIPYQLEKR